MTTHITRAACASCTAAQAIHDQHRRSRHLHDQLDRLGVPARPCAACGQTGPLVTATDRNGTSGLVCWDCVTGVDGGWITLWDGGAA